MGIAPSGQSRKHPTLGHYQAFLTSEGNHSMVVRAIVDSEAEYLRWKDGLKVVDNNQARQFLFLPQKSQYEDAACCGLGGICTVKLTFEDVYAMTLESELQLRRGKANYFLETELWYLLLAMVQVGAVLEKSGQKIGDVHPRNILISSEGSLKLLCTRSLPRQLTNFDKVVETPAENVFLAPEELDENSLKQVQYPKGVDPARAECFSIGLCMLAAGTLEETDTFYMREGLMAVNLPKINVCLQKLCLRYSSYLGWIIKGLLAVNPAQRMNCSSIYSILQSQKQRILNLEKFSIGKQAKIGGQVLYLSKTSFQKELTKVNQLDLRPIHSKANSTNIYYHPKPNTLPKGESSSPHTYLRKHFISSFQE